ncbi:hypothetical protein LINPERHAP1_LOCUS21242, partial [Linum perenne]
EIDTTSRLTRSTFPFTKEIKSSNIEILTRRRWDSETAWIGSVGGGRDRRRRRRGSEAGD